MVFPIRVALLRWLFLSSGSAAVGERKALGLLQQRQGQGRDRTEKGRSWMAVVFGRVLVWRGRSGMDGWTRDRVCFWPSCV